MGGRRYGGVGRGRLYTYGYTVTTRMTCIKMSSDESHFNVSLIVRDKVTRPCPQATTFEEKGEPQRYQTEVLPLTSLTARPNRLTRNSPPAESYVDQNNFIRSIVCQFNTDIWCCFEKKDVYVRMFYIVTNVYMVVFWLQISFCFV